ncbi:YbjN domain-containing protein [Desulfitobacterium sp.]|uniref:YbjN domain-containing protein n=1 Tax=Desulfitobacterium sp. TaxID=49981 RepID=UPI002C3DE7DD|nr:YbjN domain-containing protein [Desulfitobacterium sp.]HVJ47859.1 YbjN domain-containing protein [Desulfitobacterium sp.]
MTLFQILYQTLTENGWEFDHDDKNEILRLEIRGVNSDFHCFIIVDEEQESLLCNTHIKHKIPFPKRIEICNFMNRINYELANGNFEMDMDDGEIRFRTYLDLANTEPSQEQMMNLIWNGSQSFDTYYPGVEKIVHEEFSAEEAMAICTQEG